MFKDVEQTMTWIRDVLQEVPKRYEQNEAAIVELEQEQLDLLHVTEFSNFNASEGYSLSKEVKEVRMKRRQLKTK